jgi:hypothetical protein
VLIDQCRRQHARHIADAGHGTHDVVLRAGFERDHDLALRRAGMQLYSRQRAQRVRDGIEAVGPHVHDEAANVELAAGGRPALPGVVARLAAQDGAPRNGCLAHAVLTPVLADPSRCSTSTRETPIPKPHRRR